jgi:hypothetical protein
MNPFLIALTAFSTLDSMQSASRQAALIEQQAKADAANARLRGLETHNARLRNLDVALSTNNAIAGFTGRSDRSIDAINRRLREDASTDVARNAQNTIANIAASNLEANVARMRGQNKQRAILLDGLSSGYINYLRFKDVEGG